MPLVLNVSGLLVYLNNSWTFLNMWKYCMNVSKSVWMVVVFFSIPHCNLLFILTCGYLFQCLYKTRSFSLKDYEAVIINQSRIGTKLISKIVILLPWKVWTSLKVSPKVENHNVNPKKVLPAADFLAWFISFFYGTIFLAIESKKKNYSYNKILQEVRLCLLCN